MDRREFLTAKRKPQPVTQNRTAGRTSSGLQIYTGPWTRNEIIHLLKRTMFGAKPADVSYFESKTMIETVDELLNPVDPLPNPPVKDYSTTGALSPDNDVPAGGTWINSINNDGTIQSLRRSALKKWWIGCQINQDRSIREKMTLFWHNHFSTETADVGNGNMLYNHVNLLRTNCLGNFKQLVRSITIDSAMLIYLNGRFNTLTAPDENYARELQELFTLGKENNPNYTEADVKAAAKVLTGWQVSSTTVPFASFFTSSRHDSTNKQFSSFFNNTVITGRTGTTAGILELDDLLNMIFNKQVEVSRFIAKKLYRFFVYSEIDATTQTNVIEPLVFPNSITEFGDAYGMWNYILAAAANAGQNLGDPPSVAGWPAFYQTPQYYELWVNTDTLPKRNQFTDIMIGNGYTRNGKKIWIDAVEFTKTLPNPGDPNQLIIDVLAVIFQIELSQASRDQLKKDFLLSGQDQDYYWTNAWNAYIFNPITANYNIVNTRLRGLYKYFMNLAEYQLA